MDHIYTISMQTAGDQHFNHYFKDQEIEDVRREFLKVIWLINGKIRIFNDTSSKCWPPVEQPAMEETISLHFSNSHATALIDLVEKFANFRQGHRAIYCIKNVAIRHQILRKLTCLFNIFCDWHSTFGLLHSLTGDKKTEILSKLVLPKIEQINFTKDSP